MFADVTRVLLASAYAVVAVAALCLLPWANLFGRKLGLVGAAVVGTVWSSFYVAALVIPWEGDQGMTETLAWLSRLAHVPMVTALGLMIWAVWKVSTREHLIQQQLKDREDS